MSGQKESKEKREDVRVQGSRSANRRENSLGGGSAEKTVVERVEGESVA